MMQAIEFFNKVENLKAEFNTLKETKNCFLNTKTNQIIPVEQAGGKDLSEFNFQPELPDEMIDNIMRSKLNDIFQSCTLSDDWQEKYYIPFGDGEEYSYEMKLIVVGVEMISSTKVEYTFKILHHGKSHIKRCDESHYHKGEILNNDNISLLNSKKIKYTTNIINSPLTLNDDIIGNVIEPYLVKLNKPIIERKNGLVKVHYYPVNRLYIRKPGY